METFISHREFYTGQLVQALSFYLDDKSQEQSWMLLEAFGYANLYGVESEEVYAHLERLPVLSEEDLLVCRYMLLKEKDQNFLAKNSAFNALINSALRNKPHVDLEDLIEQYLHNIEQGVNEEWEEENDDIIIYHTSVVGAYQWLAEVVLGNATLLPHFVEDVDRLGRQISSINDSIYAHLRSFIGGIPVASFMRSGVVKDRLTDNFIFLSDEFLSLKGPQFVLPLPEKRADVPLIISAGMSREAEKPFWKKGLEEWRKGEIPPFVAANFSSTAYEFPIGKPLGILAMVKEAKRALPPALDANWIALDILVSRDMREVRLLPPETLAVKQLEKIKQILSYIRQLDAYYYAVRGESEGAVVYSCEAEQVPKSKTKVVVKDIPPETKHLIIGLHEDPDTLNRLMKGELSNESLREKRKSEVFFLFYLFTNK